VVPTSRWLRAASAHMDNSGPEREAGLRPAVQPMIKRRRWGGGRILRWRSALGLKASGWEGGVRLREGSRGCGSRLQGLGFKTKTGQIERRKEEIKRKSFLFWKATNKWIQIQIWIQTLKAMHQHVCNIKLLWLIYFILEIIKCLKEIKENYSP
jgi:hypothetical protein